MTFPQAIEVTQMSNAGTNADNVLRADIVEAIYTATETGARTSGAITWTTVSEQSMLIIAKELRGQGFTITFGSGTLTATWP